MILGVVHIGPPFRDELIWILKIEWIPMQGHVGHAYLCLRGSGVSVCLAAESTRGNRILQLGEPRHAI